MLETVDTFLRFNGATPEGTAELKLEGKRYPAKFAKVDDFGERRVTFEVPERNGTVSGKVLVGARPPRSFAVTLRPERRQARRNSMARR